MFSFPFLRVYKCALLLAFTTLIELVRQKIGDMPNLGTPPSLWHDPNMKEPPAIKRAGSERQVPEYCYYSNTEYKI